METVTRPIMKWQYYKDAIVTLYELGFSCSEIARGFGLATGGNYEGELVRRWLRCWGVPRRDRVEGARLEHARHGNFRCGIKRGDEYLLAHCPSHPRADRHGYVLLHILVWERVNNRWLPDGWVIHHLNGNKVDNRVDNLAAMPDRKHRTVISEYRKRIGELETRLAVLEAA